jgi:hypothetical protein
MMATVQLLSVTKNLQAHLNTRTPPMPSKTNSHIRGNILHLLLEKVNFDGSLDGHEYQNTIIDFRACAHNTADVSPNCCIRRLYQNDRDPIIMENEQRDAKNNADTPNE